MVAEPRSALISVASRSSRVSRSISLRKGDDVFNALGEGLAGSRDGFLHALKYTWFLFFVKTAEQRLNHECPVQNA